MSSCILVRQIQNSMIFFLVRCFYVTCEIVFFFKMCLREFLIVTVLVQPNFCNTDMSSLRTVLLLVSNSVKRKTYLIRTLLPYGQFFWSLTRLHRLLLLKLTLTREVRGMMGKRKEESLFLSLFQLPIIPFAPDAVIVSRDRFVTAYK